MRLATSPYSTEAKCKITVFGYSNPIFNNLYWVRAVLRYIHTFYPCYSRLGKDAVYPVYIYRFIVLGAITASLYTVYQRTHFFISERRLLHVGREQSCFIVQLKIYRLIGFGLYRYQCVRSITRKYYILVVIV